MADRKHTVTKTAFLTMLGMSKGSAAALFSKGKRLHACLTRSGLVDMAHPAAVEYVEFKMGGAKPAPTEPRPPPDPSKRANPKPPPPAVSGPVAGHNLVDYENLTVREVVTQYGSVDAFKRFVEAGKNIADYKLKEMSLQLKRGDLVQRDAVKNSVFALIDVAFRRLLSDVPTTLSKQIVARVQAGGPETTSDVEVMIRDACSQVLSNCKRSITKTPVLSGKSVVPIADFTSD